MSASGVTGSWPEQLKSAKKACLVQDGRRKVHYTFPSKQEMVEEYCLHTNYLLIRKWKKIGMLGGDGKWECEVGENHAGPLRQSEISENVSNPICVRQDTSDSFQWRIRNLPYPIETYQVTAADNEASITVRTSNKKKNETVITAAKHLFSPLQQHFNYYGNNLRHCDCYDDIAQQYKKPSEVLQLERDLRRELARTKASKEGDVDCAQT